MIHFGLNGFSEYVDSKWVDHDARLAGIQICGPLKEEIPEYQPDLFLRRLNPSGEDIQESSPFFQRLIIREKKRETRKFRLGLKSYSTTIAPFRVVTRDGRMKRFFRVRYRSEGKLVTAALRSGRFSLQVTKRNQSGLQVVITPRHRTLRRSRERGSLILSANATGRPGLRDQIGITAVAGSKVRSAKNCPPFVF